MHPELFHRLIELARRHHAPVAMHLAETRAEIELLRDGTGDFVEMLREFGVWSENVIPRGTRPIDYLRELATLNRGLVVHGNYLDAEERAFVAEHPSLSVIYCPRTHSYFRHELHPWQELLEHGANVALGTDSRASNPDLSLWGELLFLRQRFPECDPAVLLRLGTLNGAKALGLDAEIGSLLPGKSADVVVVNLPERDDTDPYRLLFDPHSHVVGTMIRGDWLTGPLASWS